MAKDIFSTSYAEERLRQKGVARVPVHSTYPAKLINKNLFSVTLDVTRGYLDALMEGNSVSRLKSN